MLTEQRLRDVLGKIAADATVTLHRDGMKWVAVVVSESFATLDEDERQSAAWGLILDNLPDHEQTLVEFVFTSTPEEQREAASA